ncbi:hypothetical protein N656DRAFT_776151 [Canariomyces notabilis]|uniref:Uncharacterized protein n=1 Tax=Canariomyces notabilis TaxID=2074819 RepID=A0AAN6TII7_9PEZI|nr:hypothetical protein N656DRAFT_776151 [Canariomyces arenarius]
MWDAFRYKVSPVHGTAPSATTTTCITQLIITISRYVLHHMPYRPNIPCGQAFESRPRRSELRRK